MRPPYRVRISSGQLVVAPHSVSGGDLLRPVRMTGGNQVRVPHLPPADVWLDEEPPPRGVVVYEFLIASEGYEGRDNPIVKVADQAAARLHSCRSSASGASAMRAPPAAIHALWSPITSCS